MHLEVYEEEKGRGMCARLVGHGEVMGARHVPEWSIEIQNHVL
jgi:hypothetical protein